MAETTITQEIPSGRPIHFEPGLHELSPEKWNELYVRVWNGDLDVHDWNPEVANRIATYAFNAPALLLAIDGQAAGTDDFVNTWLGLPARPNLLNHGNSVYVVKGDLVASGFKENSDNAFNSIYWQYSVEAVTGLIMLAVMHEITPEKPQIQNSTSARSPLITRREFLKTLGVTVGGVALMSPLAQLLIKFSTILPKDEDLKSFLQKLDTLISPKFLHSDWLDGRTALLMAKSSDAQSMLPNDIQDAEYAVVMGFAHSSSADEFKNKDKRALAIRRFAESYIQTGKEVWASSHHENIKQVPTSTTNSLLDYFCQFQVQKISDPGSHSFDPRIPSECKKYVATVGTYVSQEVFEVVRDLRPYR